MATKSNDNQETKAPLGRRSNGKELIPVGSTVLVALNGPRITKKTLDSRVNAYRFLIAEGMSEEDALKGAKQILHTCWVLPMNSPTAATARQ